MFGSRFSFAALVAATALFAAPATSQAGFSITVSEGSTYGTSAAGTLNNLDITSLSSTYYTVDSSGNAQFQPGSITITTGTGANTSTYSISFLASFTNTPGAAQSYLSLTSLDVSHSTTGNGSGDTNPLIISLTATGFNLPTSPVSATSLLSGGFASSGATGTATFSSYIDSSNAAYGTGTSITPNSGYVLDASSNNNSGLKYTSPNVSYTSNFSLTNTLTISGLSDGFLNSFQSGNITTDVVQATPAPAGFVMLASALPVVGLLRIRRRLAPVAAAV